MELDTLWVLMMRGRGSCPNIILIIGRPGQAGGGMGYTVGTLYGNTQTLLCFSVNSTEKGWKINCFRMIAVIAMKLIVTISFGEEAESRVRFLSSYHHWLSSSSSSTYVKWTVDPLVCLPPGDRVHNTHTRGRQVWHRMSKHEGVGVQYVLPAL